MLRIGGAERDVGSAEKELNTMIEQRDSIEPIKNGQASSPKGPCQQGELLNSLMRHQVGDLLLSQKMTRALCQFLESERMVFSLPPKDGKR